MKLNFSNYKNEIFRKIFCDAYCWETMQIAGYTFFRSKLPFKKNKLYLNPLGFHESEEIPLDIWQKICKYAKDHNLKVTFSSIAPQPAVRYKVKSSINPIIHLPTQYEDLYLQYSKNMKSNLKKLDNKCKCFGVSIVKSNNIEDLQTFYENVLAMQYTKKHRMVFQPFSLFRKLVVEEKMADFFYAQANGKIIGGIVLIKGNTTLHYNWGAYLPYSNVSIGLLLVEHTIKYAIKHNYKYYDLGSTALSDNNLLRFKNNFKPTLYTVYRYSNKKLTSSIDLHSDYSIFRTIYSKLSHRLLAKLMPIIIPLLV